MLFLLKRDESKEALIAGIILGEEMREDGKAKELKMSTFQNQDVLLIGMTKRKTYQMRRMHCRDQGEGVVILTQERVGEVALEEEVVVGMVEAEVEELLEVSMMMMVMVMVMMVTATQEEVAGLMVEAEVEEVLETTLEMMMAIIFLDEVAGLLVEEEEDLGIDPQVRTLQDEVIPVQHH